MGNLFGKDKKLVILRGLPGSGKTTLAKQLTSDGGVIFSSDDFFMDNGVYHFRSKGLKDSHLWNQSRTEKAMENGERLIVIDNTNVRKWEAKPYVKLGVAYGYKIVFKEVDTPWRFDVDQLVKHDKHMIPRDVIEKMLKQWESKFTVNNVLSSQAPWEKT